MGHRSFSDRFYRCEFVSSKKHRRRHSIRGLLDPQSSTEDFQRFTGMDRRLFLGLSGAAIPSLMSCSSARRQDEQSGAGSQTEDGVFVEDSPTTEMRGFPPENPIRAEDLHSTDDNRRRWALQHISELCKTQKISRGSCRYSASC